MAHDPFLYCRQTHSFHGSADADRNPIFAHPLDFTWLQASMAAS